MVPEVAVRPPALAESAGMAAIRPVQATPEMAGPVGRDTTEATEETAAIARVAVLEAPAVRVASDHIRAVPPEATDRPEVCVTR